MPAQAVHGGFVGQAGARAGLVESRHHGLFFQKVAVATVASNRLELICYFKDTEKFRALEILERKDITTRKTTHCKFSFIFLNYFI